MKRKRLISIGGFKIYRAFRGFDIYVGPWGARVCFSRKGWFSNGSHYFSGWHRWKEDA